MDARGLWGSRGHRTRRVYIDLNVTPNESRNQEGTSNASNARRYSSDSNGGEEFVPAPQVPPTIDVDSIDDDVVESSASAFAEAKSKSTITRRRPVMVDVDSGCTRRKSTHVSNKCRRVPPNQPVIDCDPVIVLTMPTPPPPREEPKFQCPICMCPFTQETSTKCGHIFCKECIKMAISKQGKCPTCRKKITSKSLIRIFLPATR